MSIDMMNGKIKELRELRRMADELAGEIEAIQDEIKAHMTEQNTDTLTGVDWKVTWKAVTSKRLDTTALKKALPDVAERFMKERKQAVHAGIREERIPDRLDSMTGKHP